jgi:hypothetical protein
MMTKKFVNHKDGDPKNNATPNLEVVEEERVVIPVKFTRELHDGLVERFRTDDRRVSPGQLEWLKKRLRKYLADDEAKAAAEVKAKSDALARMLGMAVGMAKGDKP